MHVVIDPGVNRKEKSNEKHCSEKQDKTSQSISYISWQCFLYNLRTQRNGYQSLLCFRGVSSTPRAIKPIIWSYCKLLACTVNNINSYSIWEFTPPNLILVPPTQVIHCILATVADCHVAEVSVVLFVLWSQWHLQLLWTRNVSSCSCCWPVGGDSWTLADGNLPAHSSMLWHQHVFIFTCWFFGYITEPSLELESKFLNGN